MPEDKSFDLVGLGRAVEAIPESAWTELVSTATDTFRNLVRPITAITGGFGRWLEQKFDNMVEVEKVLVSDGLAKAIRKIEASSRSVAPTQNLATLGQLVEGVSQANEELTREMWINLLSRDLSAESVHPEFIAILRRLSPADARLLVEIAEKSDAAKHRLAIQRMMQSARSSVMSDSMHSRLFIRMLTRRPFDLSQTILQTLNLIEVEGGVRYLTEFGKRFLEAVSEPAASPPESHG